MSIITLITDYGVKDYYVATVKGHILSCDFSANIVDISHCVSPYDLVQAGYVWLGAYKYFPNNTFHFILVDAEIGGNDRYLLAKKNQQWVIVADNGWLSIVSPYVVFDEIYAVSDIKKYANASQLCVDLWKKIEKGEEKENWCYKVELEHTKPMNVLLPFVIEDQSEIRGAVIYEDHYGNLVTNISKKMFEEIGKGRKFKFGFSRFSIDRIHAHYSDFNTDKKSLKEYEGDSILVFNEMGFLQIAIYKSSQTVGTVRSLFGLKYQDGVVLKFF